MGHFASAAFWDAYRRLPAHIRALADKNFALLESDPRHPSLQFKKVGRFRCARVGRDYRAIGVDVNDGIVWIWIGPHAQYELIIRS